MKISRQDFDKKRAENSLKIAFIGMSNIGKSLRSKQLTEEKNFARYCVDEHIGLQLGLETELEMADWLGYPDEPDFQKKQLQYLEAEASLTQNITIPTAQNFVLDTTGSVIYLSKDCHEFLRQNFLIIHLQTPDFMREKMLSKFFAEPKPLIWGNKFQKQENQSREDALKACYPELLSSRIKKYEALADISFTSFDPDPEKPFSTFWNRLCSELEKQDENTR
jgi:shikimate kinase